MLRIELEHLAGIERRRIVMPGNVAMRLNRLEKPEAWPEELVEEIRRTLPVETIHQYPAYPPFYRRLADFIGVREDRIVVGAGSEEFIRILMAGAFGQKVAVLWPTCAMVDVYAESFRVELDRIVTNPHRPPTIYNLIHSVSQGAKLVMLANPGQPVETCFSINQLQLLARHCANHGATLVVDEAYHGFGAPTALDLVREFDNVVVLRTFSKAFGAAGIRLGFAVAGERVKPALDAVRQSGEVSSLSIHIATVLMDNYSKFVWPSICEIVSARDWLRMQLAGVGLKTWGDHANHVLVDFEEPDLLEDVAKGLALEGVYPRASLPAPLDSCILITCGSPLLMSRFWKALEAHL